MFIAEDPVVAAFLETPASNLSAYSLKIGGDGVISRTILTVSLQRRGLPVGAVASDKSRVAVMTSSHDGVLRDKDEGEKREVRRFDPAGLLCRTVNNADIGSVAWEKGEKVHTSIRKKPSDR